MVPLADAIDFPNRGTASELAMVPEDNVADDPSNGDPTITSPEDAVDENPLSVIDTDVDETEPDTLDIEALTRLMKLPWADSISPEFDIAPYPTIPIADDKDIAPTNDVSANPFDTTDVLMESGATNDVDGSPSSNIAPTSDDVTDPAIDALDAPNSAIETT